MWTGEWNPAWSAAYTMDANVNLQVSGMNIGNAPEAATGYCAFVRRQLEDWEGNACQVYGMTDALLVPVNTDVRRAMMVEYDGEYPFEYWNTGAAWMALPVFEAWQCFGDLKLEDGTRLVDGLLRPLLRKTLNFWKQFCCPEYYTDAVGKPHCEPGKTALEAGERFLLVPGYSPENCPRGRKHSLAMNTAMGIAAARDCLRMVRRLERECPLPDSLSVLAACDGLEKGLPDYRLDGTGALKEWAFDAYQDNNAHRHLSHLYGAWPAFETRGNATNVKACTQAVENRERENAGKDDTPSHGWIHKLLILSRLRMGDAAADVLRRLLSTDVFYATGMTDHNTDRSRAVFCTDTLLGLQGVVQEMLIYSDVDSLELLPALPQEWKRGEVQGLRLRSGGIVEKLRWDLFAGIVQMAIMPERDVVLGICFRNDWDCDIIGEGNEREACRGKRDGTRRGRPRMWSCSSGQESKTVPSTGLFSCNQIFIKTAKAGNGRGYRQNRESVFTTESLFVMIVQDTLCNGMSTGENQLATTAINGYEFVTRGSRSWICEGLPITGIRSYPPYPLP